MNVRKISVAPLEPQSAVLPKNSKITQKNVKIYQPEVSNSDLENVRDLVLPSKPKSKPQVQEIKEETKDVIPVPITPTVIPEKIIQTSQSPNPKARIVKVMQNEGTEEQYEADVEIGAVYKRTDGHIESILTEEQFIRKTLTITAIVGFCCLSGILLILIGLAQTEAFQNMEPNPGVTTVGFVLQIPLFYWIYRKIYPSKEYIQTKKIIKKNRNYRAKALEKDDIKYVEDTNDEDRLFSEIDKIEMRKKYVMHQDLKKKNPLGYPTPGVTRKRWDDS